MPEWVPQVPQVVEVEVEAVAVAVARKVPHLHQSLPVE
jgi:hypothetical protein